MARKRTAAEVGDSRIGAADLASKRKAGPSAGYIEMGEHLLHIQSSPCRPAVPEPVDVSRAIGRQPAGWEAGLIAEVRLAERAREAVILRGAGS